MPKRGQELWIALLGVLVVTALYALAYAQAGEFPRASGLVGHGIGILGFVLMLATETLYSIRKRVTDARWGSIAAWLKAHIVTGLLGPYMVLLHAAVRFNGIAGVAMLLTAVVVASGVVGRYLYTRGPRVDLNLVPAATGIDAADASAQRRALARWYAFHVPLTWVLFAIAFVHAVGALYYATLQR
jgi:hypothetical protein